uniref:Major capsid protein n=1 Tax=Mimiviridae sp. ChoanoV1 TaxID=2596887 RepID=A0A5B8IEZ3_9VIRU|nr:hypothetical protein 1_303 [Mimiviridae sp. ChoanoV1]
MGGGLMQLVAYGAQDIYLTGNPQITFFKVVYRRHTNFSIETIAQTFNGSADFNNKAQVTISRNGDLIGPMVLEVKLPKLDQTGQGAVVTAANYTNGIGNALIKSVSVEIGGQQIDKHYGEWLDIWGELNVKADHRVAYDQMVGNTFDRDISDPVTLTTNHETTLYVPLRFWFNRNPGLALPLIALQYHEVKLHFEFEDSRHLIRTLGAEATGMPQSSGGGDVTMKSCQLLVDYIYLDTDERRRFAQVSHEYLIEQLQFTGAESISSGDTTRKVDLNFNHPVKALHWVIQNETFLSTSSYASGRGDRRIEGNQKLRYSGVNHDDTQTAYETFKNAKIQLNGHDRMSVRDADYFRVVQNDQHSEVVPRKMIYTYSFALKPSEHQPSGTCNFSRIDNAQLNLEFNSSAHTFTNDREMRVFAVNYNVLRIMSGMGGLAYSN